MKIGVGEMYQRIVIVGTPGSGKSTLAERIGERLHIPVTHLDQFAWEDGELVAPHILEQRIVNLVKNEKWICDGTYSKTLEVRIKNADLLIWLTDSRWKCILRVIYRYVKSKFSPQIGHNPDIISLDFLIYIWNYNKKFEVLINECYAPYRSSCELWIR